MYIIGDVHGCYIQLLKLIDKIKEHSNSDTPDICFVGDLIDRGPQSREVVELVKNNYHCVLGNHEDAMVEAMATEDPTNSVWYEYNGGDTTLKSYEDHPEQLQEHLDWFKTLPVYKEFPDVKIHDTRSRHLVASHSSIARVWDQRNEVDIKEHTIWNRDVQYGTLKSANEIYNVFGHTPVKKPLLKPGYALIDTGAAYGFKLTALHVPSLDIITQE